MAALAAPDTKTADPPASLTWWVRNQSWKSEDLVDFLQHALPPDRGVPRVVVMDNASIHRGTKVREALPDLRAQNLELEYLPAYSPELNDIEHVFRKAKHEAMPQRLQPNQRASHSGRACLLPGPPGPTCIFIFIHAIGLDAKVSSHPCHWHQPLRPLPAA